MGIHGMLLVLIVWATFNAMLIHAKAAEVHEQCSLIDLHVMYKNQEIANTSNTTFIGLTLDNTFSWKNHIDIIVPKLSSACFAVRAGKPFLSQESLRIVYFSYFHSIITHGLVSGGNSYHSNTVFKLQKRIIRIMVGITGRVMQRIFQEIKNTATAGSIYIYIYILTLIRNNLDLHYPQSHLSMYQTSAYCTGIKVFSRLPVPIKQLFRDTKQFKIALKGFLYLHSFYSLDEHFKYNTN
jgi:hypothetical protein